MKYMKRMRHAERSVNQDDSAINWRIRSVLPATAWLLLALCAMTSSTVWAEKVEVGDKLARFDLIQPATRHYLRYRIVDGHNLAMDIWTRKVSFEKQDGERRLHIVQQWDGPYRAETIVTRDSWFEVGTFRPLTHRRHTTWSGGELDERFRFEPTRIVQLAAGADQPEQVIESPQAAFNFETDMEFLGALPLADGYEAEIVFYHPGGRPPATYRFRVAGSEQLRLPGGTKVDCWLVTTDYNRPDHVARFWLDKATQTVLKVVKPMPDGGRTVKVLLY